MLYIVGTPIGNLEDMTLRALRILREVDVIYCEDTRHSIKLLTHFEISKPLYSYHEHNKDKVGPEVIQKLRSGQAIALVSDAGMPGISDPGQDLIRKCIEEEMEYTIIPGVTAFSTALVGSGMDNHAFTFEGFLSRDKRQKKAHLERLKGERRTLIFYESPHRLKETLKIMGEILGNRQIVLARELTKKYEEYRRGSLESLLEYYQNNEIKGEIVLILEGSSEIKVDQNPLLEMSISAHALYYMEKGFTKKEALKCVAKDRGIKKSDIYKETLDL